MYLIFTSSISALAGSSVMEAVTSERSMLPDPAMVQCYGCDWLPRLPDHVAGVRLLLNSAEEMEICSAVRATLEIVRLSLIHCITYRVRLPIIGHF